MFKDSGKIFPLIKKLVTLISVLVFNTNKIIINKKSRRTMLKNQFLRKKTFRFKRFERKSYSAYNSMHKAVTIGVVSIMMLSSLGAKTVKAQTTKDTIAMFDTLQEVTISDELSTPINQEGKIVTIITKQEIENLKPQSVAELLSFATGIDIQTRGAHSVQADISLRGGNFDQTAVLLNGINITNPHTGHYSLDIPINISDIERIEVIKGPTAIIYGASAFSGGINIVTKKNVDKSFDVTLEGGEHGFVNTELSAAYTYKNVENYLSFGYKNSEGYIANSDYNIYNLLYQNRINFNRNNKLDFQIGYNNKSYGANTFYSAKYPNQHDKTSSFLTSLKGKFDIAENFSIIPSIYYNQHTDEYELIKDVSTPNYHKTNVFGNNVSFVYSFKRFRLNFGSDIRYEEILSSVLGEPCTLHGNHYNHHKDRINFSYFLQGRYLFDKADLTLGLMTFQNTSFNQKLFNVYPSINFNYFFNNHWQAYASFNSSSRLPSFTELYYKDAIHQSNPDLKQEKSLSFEIGAKNTNAVAQTSLNIYFMKGSDMIDWVKYSPSDEKWQSRNINKLDKYGVEFDSKLFLNSFIGFLLPNSTLNISYSYMHQEQGNIDYISAYALNYLKHKASVRLTLPIIKNLTLTLAGKFCVREGSYIKYDRYIENDEVKFNESEQSFSPFFTMDGNLSYQYRHFNFYISCTNMMNREYFDIGNIPQPGRWFIGGVKYNL